MLLTDEPPWGTEEKRGESCYRQARHGLGLKGSREARIPRKRLSPFDLSSEIKFHALFWGGKK